MKPTLISKSLVTLVNAAQPVFLWGAPGIGKSDIVHQVADGLGVDLSDVRAVLLDPVDLRGLPYVNGDNRSHWAIPEFLPRDGNGILFLDELNAAPALVQAGCYQLVLNRRLGEYVLPDGWQIVAAGNRDTDRAVTHRMPSALANRFVHLEFEVDNDDWTRWALGNNVRTEIVAFLRFRPELLHNFDPTVKAFPTPRSWAFVSRLLDQNPDKETEFGLIQGTVGEGAAAEFVGFLQVYRNLPDPDGIMMNPDSAPVPEDPATLYALCGALSRKASPDNFDRVKTYTERLPAEFGVVLVRDAISRTPDVQQTRAFIDWAADNQHVLV